MEGLGGLGFREQHYTCLVGFGGFLVRFNLRSQGLGFRGLFRGNACCGTSKNDFEVVYPIPHGVRCTRRPACGVMSAAALVSDVPEGPNPKNPKPKPETL